MYDFTQYQSRQIICLKIVPFLCYLIFLSKNEKVKFCDYILPYARATYNSHIQNINTATKIADNTISYANRRVLFVFHDNSNISNIWRVFAVANDFVSEQF